MNTKKTNPIEKISFVSLSLFSFIFICVLLFALPHQSKAQDNTSCSNDTGATLRLPIDGVWRITQGYNCLGSGCTHILYNSGFDLRYALDFGELNYLTANQPVFAPGDGLVVTGGGSAGGYDEIICINLDGLGSMEIGHFETRNDPQYKIPQPGTRVSRGEIIGQLLAGPSTISSAAHLHIAYYDNDSCYHATTPFDNLFGFDLSNDGSYNRFGPQYNGFTTEHQTVGCGATPDPGAYLLGSNVLTEAFYNSYIFTPIESYVSVYNIKIDTSFITVAQSPIEDDSLVAVLIRLVKEGINYGPWILSLMIVITGFMFLTSMGITTRIMKARRLFMFTIIGTTLLLSMIALIELMEITLLDQVAQLGKILKYFV